MMNTRNRELSDKQSDFINGVVNLGLKQTESARRAGYNQPAQSAYNMMNSPAILHRIQQERLKLFQSDLSIVAVQTLKEIMQDQQAPASARVSACRSVLEIAGDFKAGQGTSDKSLSDMSPAELASVIDKLDVERIRIAKDVSQTATIVQQPAVEAATA